MKPVHLATTVESPVPSAPSAPVGPADPSLPIKNSKECPRREEIVRLKKSGPALTVVRVCGGVFRMGDDASDQDDEWPAHNVQVSSFWIGKYEVSNAQFRSFSPGHQPGEEASWPATNVKWNEASSFCENLGLRLPSEAEWEYAARGPEARSYPWGDAHPTKKLAVMAQVMPDDVTAMASIDSPFGTVNQAGNVSEWVQDAYSDVTYSQRFQRLAIDPVVEYPWHPSTSRVVRGGSFWDTRNLRSASRSRGGYGTELPNVGFRCARSSQP